MKRKINFFFTLLIFCASCIKSYSQIEDCGARILNGCNFITNNTFTPSSQYIPANHWADPFRYQPESLIPEWRASHGSPNVYDGINYPNTLPFPGARYAGMAAGYIIDDPTNEGIVQKITTLQAGKEYAFSFFKKKDTFNPLAGSVDNLFIVLMHCSDYATFNTDLHVIPQRPANSQEIFNTGVVSNTEWEQIFFCFRAEQNYNMVWVYPQQNRFTPNTGYVLFSYPEIIDISAFNAGPNPTPTLPNCNVTIGPQNPNCGVRNALFTWTGPSNQTINAPPNQQIQVNAADLPNVGQWTLSMTVPNAVNSNNQCDIRSTISIPTCRAAVWPKVYYGDKYPQLFKGQNGNIYLDIGLHNISPNINHIGVLPTPPFDNSFTFQYNSLSGATDWVNRDQVVTYVFNSGDLQVYTTAGGIGQNYISGSTGLPIAPPINLPPGHKVIGEKSSNEFIVLHRYVIGMMVHTDLYLYVGNTPVSSYQLDWVHSIKYNPISKKLFVILYLPLPGYPSALAVFDLTNNTFNIDPNTNPYVPLDLYDRVVQVDDFDRIYVVHNGILQIFNYTIGSYTPVNIPGFSNNNIVAFYSDSEISSNGSYTGNKCLIGQVAEEKIYALDLVGLTQRNISTANFLDPSHSFWASESTDYIIDGNSVFLAGSIHGSIQNFVRFGNQQINFLGVGDFSNFLTKLDLNVDFEDRSTENDNKLLEENLLTVKLFPNPSQNSIRINISDTGREKRDSYSYIISIFNKENNIVFRKGNYQSESEIDISRLKTGIYYVEVIGANGIRAVRSFVKL